MTLRLYTLVLCTAIGLSGLSGRLRADSHADGASASQARAAAPAASAAADPFPGLKFRNIGPATMGGRIDDLAVLESNPAVFYVGTATGGLWKTMNNGTTWEVLFDDLDDTVSIGDIAINPNDANTVWVGSGENNNRQSGSWGNGLYKSIDGGKTLKHMGLGTSKHIARIIVDPIDHDVVYVAALGSLWGRGGERGVFKTTDGGLTWTRVLFVDDETGATELVMDPSNNKVIYAATYQRRRATWGFNGGGPGSAMWKSSDAGRTWTKLTSGVPTGPLGRIGMDVYRANPNIVYARIEHAKESGTYRSDDAGPDVAEDVGHQPAADVLQPDPHRSEIDARIYVLGVQISHLGRRRQDVHRQRRRCIAITTRCGSIPNNPEPHHRRHRRRRRHQLRSRARPGKASTTWTSGSSTTSPTTWRRPTTSTAACRTTTRGADRARCAAARASSTTTGSRCRAATASTCRSIRRIRAPSTRSRRTATSRASIASPTSASRSGRCRRRAKRRTAGTGTRRS